MEHASSAHGKETPSPSSRFPPSLTFWVVSTRSEDAGFRDPSSSSRLPSLRRGTKEGEA